MTRLKLAGPTAVAAGPSPDHWATRQSSDATSDGSLLRRFRAQRPGRTELYLRYAAGPPPCQGQLRRRPGQRFDAEDIVQSSSLLFPPRPRGHYQVPDGEEL